ncbi:MAG: CvpA family protein [Clostridia bacterium]|nr:CvpA family protein [Clostridia bacterium]
MGIIIDFILIGIIIISAILGWKRGFFRSIMKFGSVIIAAVGSYFLNGVFSSFLKSTFIMPKISEYIYKSYTKIFGGMSLSELFSEMPEYFSKWLDSYSGVEKAKVWYSGTAKASEKGLCNSLAEPIAEKISTVTAYILAFIAILIVIRIICFVVDRFLSLPVLNGVNKLFGLIFGIATGLIVSWICAEVLRLGVPELAKIYPVFQGAEQSSVFLTVLCSFNPLTIFDVFKSKIK